MLAKEFGRFEENESFNIFDVEFKTYATECNFLFGKFKMLILLPFLENKF